MTILSFILRLLVAIAAGGAVGLERQINNKSAGLRTNTLVAVGSCIYVLVNLRLTGIAGDPTRIIGQIVTGIGFLGAGVIMHRGANVQGLTTAATIWCSAALGVLAGLNLFLEALVSTVLIITVNSGFKIADRFIGNHDAESKNDSKMD